MEFRVPASPTSADTFLKHYRVFYIEEPELTDHQEASMRLQTIAPNLVVATALLPKDLIGHNVGVAMNNLLAALFREHHISPDIFWYYTPMALRFTTHFQPALVVYDCMDELSNFKFAPPELAELEKQLFAQADVVFTGGHSLYKAKMNAHKNIWPVPSSIDKEHFMRARSEVYEPADQAPIPHPRIGFYGVIDERFDIELLKEAAVKEPGWQFVILGPVVKIDAADLPRLPNIHYLGSKTYEELPQYLAGWDMATIPFLLNEATRYISPTKTPEYLAAGVPVVSTAIEDVVIPYGTNLLTHIVADADEFIQACKTEWQNKDMEAWRRRVDLFLADNSWDKTWQFMQQRINERTQFKKSTVSTLAASLNSKIQAHV